MFERGQILLLVFTLVACAAPAAADELLRDPTRPYFIDPTPVARTPAFNVSAIFVSKQRRVAILNGRTVTAGDRVDGALVRAIGERGVKLDYQGRTIHAELLTAKIRE